MEEIEETELNGVEEGGDRIESEEQLAAPDWRVRAEP